MNPPPTTPAAVHLHEISIEGARTHNLKNITCTIPHGRLTVVTGPSGSGKSSLAFDTLYAEGQRRYVESLSTYVRQFLERMERPDVDWIGGIQPAIALEQKNGVRSARSTVGTATEVHDYLRLLFAKIGEVRCPECDVVVRPETPDTALKALEQLEPRTRMLVLGPLEAGHGGVSDSLRAELLRGGFTRLWDGAGIVDLDPAPEPHADEALLVAEQPPAYGHSEAHRQHGGSWAVVVDRLAYNAERLNRLRQALETAFQIGHGRARIQLTDTGEALSFSSGLACDSCGRSFDRPQPAMFSFYSPLGACPRCEGFGRIMEIDYDKVLPNRDLCIEDGAIAPWNSEGNIELYDHLRESTTPAQIPRLKPINDFTPAQFRNLIHGVDGFCGIRGYFDWLESKRYKVQARVMLARYRAYHACPECGGTRLKPEALNVRVDGRTIAEICALPVRLLRPYFDELELPPAERQIAERALENLRSRLRYLDEVGLGYLTLDRQTRTLSGGEAQRINLATALGSALTDTLYVLDEPTVGLHPRDTDRLIHILLALREKGNTLCVVEHDLDVIRAADRILDLGPGAGEWGGELLFAGEIEDLAERDTATARFIRGYHAPPVASRGRKPTGWVRIRGARGHNLKNLNVRLPLGVFALVTGVSGSGKTTLVRDTLCAHYRRLREIAPVEAEPCDGLEGLEGIESLVWVDQSPLAGSSRSNPVTFVKAYDAIRKLLAGTREARAIGLQPRDFSFNVEGGRCEACQGTGRQTIDMHFMADVEVMCDQCDGRRFQQRVLQLHWNGRNIHDILELTVDEAARFFTGEPKVVRALKPLREVGLGYVRLGQSTTTLSGGEAQRLKLAAHLIGRQPTKNALGVARDGKLFVFDEPTTGLHPVDLERLLKVFQAMVDRGHSVLVIEHNLDVIAMADWIVDLGPEGGDLGGEILAEGAPEAIMACERSLTGRYLKARFGDG